MDFSEAIDNKISLTENGMKVRETSANACTDLFFQIGASRGKDIIPLFIRAFIENENYAVRIAQWVRDIRGGAGERKLFKDILSYIEKNDFQLAKRIIVKIPEIGRWDDMLIDYSNDYVKDFAYNFYFSAIKRGDGLAAKWAPRKGKTAVALRTAWKMSPKQYRKTLVNLTKVVETQMCKKDWNEIDFSKVPSLAHSRYRQAFEKNSITYKNYVESLVNGDSSVKINAEAVYPYDVLKGIQFNPYEYYNAKEFELSEIQKKVIISQWEALENFIGDENILPMVDVSGSMTVPVGGNSNLSCLDVAISLGLYCSEKNKGSFEDIFLTFSSVPKLMKLKGNVIQRFYQMIKSDWGMTTNLHAAFKEILTLAVENELSEDAMPESILILSDMQFDHCVEYNNSAMEMIKRKYQSYGYKVPKIIFWNLNSYDNVPVKFDESGVALISGFSPAILKTVLAAKDFNPISIMVDTIMIDKYNY